MAEIIVKAKDSTSPHPLSSKMGMPIDVRPDGWQWGSGEGLPNFVLIKIPGVSVNTVLKYIQPWFDTDGETMLGKRLWRIRWADLPAGAKTKLANNGFLTIKVGSYAGSYDYTWTQIKTFFRNLATNTDETAEL